MVVGFVAGRVVCSLGVVDILLLLYGVMGAWGLAWWLGRSAAVGFWGRWAGWLRGLGGGGGGRCRGLLVLYGALRVIVGILRASCSGRSVWLQGLDRLRAVLAL